MLELLGSYTLVDFIPVEPQVYLRLFERANEALWPLPLLGVFLGVVLAVIVIRGKSAVKSWRLFIWGTLACTWFLVSYQFHWNLLAELNWSGKLFGLLFAVQGFLLLLTCFTDISRQRFTKRSVAELSGVVMMTFGAIIYPLLPVLSERTWQSAEFFGMAPDPTCLLTLGALLATHSARWWLLLIPLTWCVISGLLGYGMGFFSNLLLPAAGLAALVVAVLASIKEKIGE